MFHTGKIIQIIGDVIDDRFSETASLPSILNALYIKRLLGNWLP